MDITDKILKNEKYREIIDNFDDETLKMVAEDHLKALEAARKGIEQEEPEKVNDIEYLEAMAKAVQKLAKSILQRSRK